MGDRSGQQLGNYRLIHLLGQGGFAEVYLAEHIYLKTQVAVKVLHAELAKDEFAGFLQEAQTIARLKHPHIIPILDFGIDGTPYLVMEYLPQGSLRQRHPRGSRVPFPTIVSYVNQIASALQYAHDNRVIHRDVKPENMLVSSTGEIVLSDFGIATIAHQTASLKTVNASGTPAYMAPEHIAGKPRPASDQYALGVVVYEWLSGSTPFQGEPMAIMYQQTYAPVPSLPIPSLREQDTRITEQTEQVVLQALAKDLQQRFESIQAFATALDLQLSIRLVEEQFVQRIILALQTNTITVEQSRQAAVDFVALKPFKDKRAMLEGLKTLGKTYAVAQQMYLDASSSHEEMLRRIKEVKDMSAQKSAEFKKRET